MSHIDAGPLPAYNSLMDPHLAGYFGNRKMRRHLRQQGLVTRKGEIVSENTYRLNMARKEHKKHVRDMLAQAIVHKTLDMERARQVQIKRKLEEIAKIELVRRVQGERGRKGDEEILPYLSKGELDTAMRQYSGKPQHMVRPSSVPAKGRRARGGRPVSAPGRSSSGKRAGSAKTESYYVDEDGFPVSASEKPKRAQSAHSSRRKGSAKYPTDEIDDRHLYALNQETLYKYTQLMNDMEQGRGPSPYTLPQLPMMESMTPRPPGPPRSNCPIKKSRRRIQHTDALGRPIKYKEQNKGYLLLHRTEPALKHQERMQTLCDVTMHYFGSNLKLDYERTDPTDEVMIEQQHCGGNTLIVFRERILAHSDFTFTSRRHRGYPFSLTFYVNGVQDCRLSCCCEYKHSRGARMGGKAGKFAVLGIEGAAPCYKCQISDSMKDGSKKKKKDKKGKNKKEQEKEKEKSDDDGDAYEDDEYTDDDEEEEEKKEEEVDVRGMTDDEEKDKYDYSSDDDHDGDKKGNESDASSKSSRSSRSSKTSKTSKTSRSSSRSRSRSSSRSKSGSEDESTKKSSDRRNSDSDTHDLTRPVSRAGHAPFSSGSESDSDKAPTGKPPSGQKKNKKSPTDSARSTASSSSSSSSSSRASSRKQDKQKGAKKNEKVKKKDDSSEQDSEIEKSMAVVRATVENVDSDEDTDRAQSPHRVKTSAEVYAEPKQDELETTKESDATNRSGDSNGHEVKKEMQKVLDSTTKEAVTGSSDSDSSSDSSDSSSDSSDSSSEEKSKSEPKEVSKTAVSATDTGGFDSSDYHGGHDPDRVAGGTGSAANLGSLGTTPGAKHNGSIKPLLESQSNVELSGLALDSNQVDELCNHLSKLEDSESLILRNASATDESLAKISESLKESTADLKMLNLNLNNITDSGIHNVVDIVKSKPNLEILLLHGNPLGDVGVRELVSGLEEIHKSDQISEEQAQAISAAAKDMATDVLKEALQSSSFGSVGTQSSDGSNESQTAALVEAIESRNYRGSGLKLQQLDLGDCHLTDVGARQVAKLIEMNTSITNLALSGNKGISSDGWRYITDALKRNIFISTISLDYNNLGDDGAMLIAEALKENKTLVSVDLEGNKIGQAGAQNLLSALRENRSVKDITVMPGNKIDDQTLNDIKRAVSR